MRKRRGQASKLVRTAVISLATYRYRFELLVLLYSFNKQKILKAQSLYFLIVCRGGQGNGVHLSKIVNNSSHLAVKIMFVLFLSHLDIFYKLILVLKNIMYILKTKDYVVRNRPLGRGDFI